MTTTVALFLLLAPAQAQAQAVAPSPTGITVEVDPGGRYAVSIADPAWSFRGDTGQPLTDVSLQSGADSAGAFLEIVFHYADGTAREAAIRNYQNRPVVVFRMTNADAAANSVAFPAWTTYPRDVYHLAYEGLFGGYNFDLVAGASPWVLFDSLGNSVILSPASNFLVAYTSLGPNREIRCGIDPRIPVLPQAFTYRTILAFDNGIGRAFESWGRALTDMYGKARPANDADPILARLGYWTDNGAAYYYRYNPDLGYAGTLLAVRDEFARKQVPLGYLQLDSWFYPKGPAADWRDASEGIYRYVADPSLFPAGLKAFQQELGLPLVTHSRWISRSSPYRTQYRMSGNVPVDEGFWNEVAVYLKDAGVAAYEQDWLGSEAQAAFNLDDPTAFMNQMGRAMSERRLTMQYSMPLPRHFLTSVRYANLTTIRASRDRFDPSKWTEFLYASRLASALGIWPFTDVTMSTEPANLLLATLSAGPLGVGDPLGSVDAANLLRSVRADGVIVKPDAPIVPLDEVAIRDAQGVPGPMVAATYSSFGGLKATYVFAYARAGEPSFVLQPAALGYTGLVYIYDYLARAGAVFDAQSPVVCSLANGIAYYIVAPVGPSGIAFLGDLGHFVPLGKKRIAQVTDDGTLEATVLFAEGEAPRIISGYSPWPPASARWDPATRLFQIEVSPDSGGVAQIRISAAASPAPEQSRSYSRASLPGPRNSEPAQTGASPTPSRARPSTR